MLASRAAFAYRGDVEPSFADLSPAARDVLQSAEFRTIAACCRWPDDAARRAAIAAAGREVSDWERLAVMTERHRVRGLVHQGLTSASVAVPPAVAERLAGAARIIAIENLRMAAEVARIGGALDAAGIGHAFFKGATLAERAYGTQALKEGVDIDLLVDDGALDRVCAIMGDLGFRMRRPLKGSRQWAYIRKVQKDVTLVHATSGIAVEVHWRLTLYPELMPGRLADVSTDRVEIHRYGVATLGLADLPIYLAVHGSNDAWHRLKWLADFAALMRGLSGEQIDEVAARARQVGAERALNQAFELSAVLLGHSPHRPRSQRLQRGSRFALHVLAGRGAAEDLKLTGVLSSRILLSRAGLRPRLRHRVRVMETFLFGPDDGVDFPLPPALFPLYPLLRLPLWVRRKLRSAR